MDWQGDRLTELIIDCIINVHRVLGPGFLGSVYRQILLTELTRRALSVETEKRIAVYYEGEEVGRQRLAILVESRVIVELKTVDDLSKTRYAQVRSYLKATRLQVAILVNSAKEKADFRRIEARD